MGIVGNLIFAPVLSLFLIISSLLFFCELLHIPNGLLVSTLNYVTKFWEYALSLGQANWLTGFKQPNSVFLLLIPIITFVILFQKKINTVNKKFYALSMFFCFTLLLLNAQSWINIKSEKTIFNNSKKYRKKLKITCNKSQLILYDYGFLSSKRNLTNFLEYELKPYCLKHFGTTNIKQLKLLKKTNRKDKIYKEVGGVFELKKYHSKIDL